MIPDSSGATPFGIFILADDFLAASTAAVMPGRSHGPTNLLALHAAELFLKAFMRSHGMLIADLRALQHDLSWMIAKAGEFGLSLPGGTTRTAEAMSETNEYVRVRYMVVNEPGNLTPKRIAEFVAHIREAVRLALDFDEFGNPQGALWAAEIPADYPRA